jgi:hypothetical protein
MKKIILVVLILTLIFSNYSFASIRWSNDSSYNTYVNDISQKELLLDSKVGVYVTREEFTRMILEFYCAYSGTAMEDISIVSEFTDTNNVYIAKAKNVGIISGYTSTTFKPTQTITREQMAVIIYRMFSKIGMNPLKGLSSSYSDFSIVYSDFKDAVAYMQKEGIITGNNGKFMPKDNATIEQALVIIDRMSIKYGQYSQVPQYENVNLLNGFSISTNYSVLAYEVKAESILLKIISNPVTNGFKYEIQRYEIFNSLISSSKFKLEEVVKILDFIHNNYDATNKSYLKNSFDLNLQSGNKVHIDSDKILTLTVK